MDSIILESEDHKKFETDRDTVKYIGMVNDMLQNLAGHVEDNNIVKLPIKAIVLDKVLQWAVHCKTVEAKSAEQNPNFEDDFIKANRDAVFELINAANFLNFPQMLDQLCQSVAKLMRNKTSEQLCEEFQIQESD